MVGCIETSTAGLIIRVLLSLSSKLKSLVVDVVVSLRNLGIHLRNISLIQLLFYFLSTASSISRSKIMITLFIVIVVGDLTLVIIVNLQLLINPSISMLIVVLTQRSQHI